MNKEDLIISLLKEIDENITNVNDSEGTNTKFEELTITSNGTYTPQEGVDGFSKVVANVVQKRKVVLQSGTRISNTQIIDGYWAGELVDMSTCTSALQLFLDCSNLKHVDVSDWDTSNIINMFMMFRNCNLLLSLDVSKWDVSSVTNMSQMFNPCYNLETLDVSNWDVSNVLDMSSMFSGCRSLKVIDISKWNILQNTNISAMFNDCRSVEHLDVANFYTSNKENVGLLFSGCSSLKSLEVAHWDVSNFKSLQGLFYNGGAELIELDLSAWDTRNVTNMSQTFGNSVNRKWLNITNWDASNVTNVYAMFYNNDNLTTFVGDNTLEDVINKNIKVLDGFRISTNNWQISSINRASLRALINGLADLTGETPQTLSLNKAINKLTEEDIAIATAKNWTIA